MPTPRAALVALLLALPAARAGAADVLLRSVEALEGDMTEVRLHLSGPMTKTPDAHLVAKGGDHPDRLTIDLPGVQVKHPREADVGWGGITRMRVAAGDGGTARVVLDLAGPVEFQVKPKGAIVSVLVQADAGVDARTQGAPAAAPAPAAPAPASPPADGGGATK